MHEGHRQRMLQRLETAEQSLQDHEILEILLFNAIPRKNTNEIAHALLVSFGSLEEVFRADVAALKTVKGVGSETAAYLRCIGICSKQNKSAQTTDFPKTLVPEEMERFLTERYALLSEEVIEVYCINKHEKITSCKRFSDRLAKEATVDVNDLNALFLSQKPHAIVVAHNHPTATCTPSESDDRFTVLLTLYCSFNHIRLYDHIIVGTDGSYSYYKTRRLEEYQSDCQPEKLLDKFPFPAQS